MKSAVELYKHFKMTFLLFRISGVFSSLSPPPPPPPQVPQNRSKPLNVRLRELVSREQHHY